MTLLSNDRREAWCEGNVQRMEARRLVIIDGYSLLFRAFYATRYLSTTDGRPTNALFGFTSMLFSLIEKVRPDAVVVALDAPGKTFRHAEFSEYKGTRKETPDELRVQLKAARHLIASLGIPSVEVTGFEADDVVGTISDKAEHNGYETTIVTGDLDSLQLVDDKVSVVTPRIGMSDTMTYTPDAVRERYGFGPEHVPDFKALKGDASDNIPGVPGIGDKGGAELIQRFGTVEEIAAKLSEVEPKYLKRIEGNVEQMLQSKRLATIVRDVPLEYSFEPFRLTTQELAAGKALMEDYEFRSLAKRIEAVLGPYVEGGAPTPAAAVESEKLETQVEDAGSYAALAKFVGNAPFALLFASPTKSDLFEEPPRVAFAASGKRVARCSEADALQLLASAPGNAILHDAKPQYRSLPAQSPPPGFDTMLAGFVLQSGRSNYALRDLVSGYLDIAIPETHEEMAAALGLLAEPMRERLVKEEQLNVLTEIELPLIPVLAEMENLGIRVSGQKLRDFSKELEGAIEVSAAKVYEYAGRTFTIGSPKQLGEVLFDEMKLPGQKKTKTGYATGAEVLEELAASVPIAAEVLHWRELTKLKSTYTDALERLIRADGRIHTTYNQAGAATGRLSSNDPNLQNIPVRTELGRSIRSAFHSEEGFLLASLDYSQIELRVLAHMCGEPALVEAFRTGQDVHAATAREMFALGSEAPSKEQRGQAKMLNYAVLYGVTDSGLAQQLGVGFSRAEAKHLIDLYYERFPTVREFIAGVVAEAKSKGFTRTLCGRRRYFPDIHAARVLDRMYAERQAMNAPLQGTAADMIKLAMIQCRKRLGASATRLLLTVHDELVFELADAEHELIEPIRKEMENALPLNVPVVADAKIGPNWLEMKEI